MNRLIVELKEYRKACDIFDFFYNEKDAVFLDSSLENNMGNYSIIGLNSYLNITVKNNILYVDGEKNNLSFESFILLILC